MSQLFELVQNHRDALLAAAATVAVAVPVVWFAARSSFLQSRDAMLLLRSNLMSYGLAYVRVFPAVGRVEANDYFAKLMGWDSVPSDLQEMILRLDESSREKCRKYFEYHKENNSAMVWRTDHGRYVEVMPVKEHFEEHAITWICYDVTQDYQHVLSLQAEQDTLKDQVRRYSAILNDTDTLVWTRDASMRIQYCNMAFTLAVSSDETEIESEESDIGVPELYRQAPALARKAQETGELQRERRYVVVAGQRRYYQITESWIAELGMSVGLARDITELGEAEEEISRHRSLLNDLLESSTSGVAIFGADRRLKSYNQAYVRMWGFGEAWLDAQPNFGEVLEFLRENRKLPEQANFTAFKKQQLRVFTDLMEPEEEFFYLPDGRTLRNVRIPHTMGGVLLTYEDVTDRLALERSYNTLIAVQRETLDNLHEGVIVFGEDGKVRLSNPVFRIMWELREADVAQGVHVSSILEAMRPLCAASDWEAYKSESIAQLQSRKLLASRTDRADGKVLDWSIVPLPDGGTLLTYIDITDTTLVELSLREKNEALQAADRLKSEFLANVSYELRSPLTSISGFSEMLALDYFGELTEKQREYVDGINASSQQLMHIVNDILDLASIEAGYMKLEIAEFNILEMIQSVLLLVVERVKQSQLTLEVKCASDIGMFKADEKRLRQVLFHLLSNAVKFSPPETQVEIGASREEDGLHLWVKDQGEGIDTEVQHYVFDKFYRGKDGARKSGAGLGLSMVRSFIDLHGGSILLDSVAGRGTLITCVIPYNVAKTGDDAAVM
jgi:PAS domain S-box-containing protein